MIDWSLISDIFPSLSQINPRTLLDAMRDPIDFAFSPFIELYQFSRTSISWQTAVKTIDLRQYIPVSFAELPGAWRAIDPRTYVEKWEGMDNIGRLVLLGCEVGIGTMIVIDLMVYYSTKATTVLLEDNPVIHNNEASLPVDPSLSQAETNSEFKSTSTNRTSTTATTTTTTSTIADTDKNDFEDHRKISPYQNSSQDYIPPDRILQQYIRPNNSFWPPYYLQAFHKAQESVQGDYNGHADALPSSGTRNNKDGCVGKIVLDKKIVKKDLKNGAVAFREGITGTGNWEGIVWK